MSLRLSQKKIMNKHQRFIFVAQTQAIVNDIRLNRNIAGQVVDEICKIDIKKVPEDVGRAALQYVDYSYGGAKPTWLQN